MSAVFPGRRYGPRSNVSQEPLGLPEQAAHGELEMGHLHRDLRLAARSDRLVDCRPELAVFAAHVADVSAAVLRRDRARSTTSDSE